MKKLIFISTLFVNINCFAEPSIDWKSITGNDYRKFKIWVNTNSNDKISVYSLDSYPCIANAGGILDASYEITKANSKSLNIRCVLKPEVITLGYKIKDSKKPTVFPEGAKIEGVIDCPVRPQDGDSTKLIYQVFIEDCHERTITSNSFFKN